MNSFSLRPARNTPEDITLLARYFHLLAAHDGHTSDADPQTLGAELFRPATNVKAFLATLSGQEIGFACGYESFSVYTANRGFYITGLYIDQPYRGQGYGKQMLASLANYALKENCASLRLLVESDNIASQKFYESQGAMLSPNWTYVGLYKDALEKLASKPAI